MDRAEVGKQCPADWLPACVSKVLLEHSQSIHLHSVCSCFCVTTAKLNSGSKKNLHRSPTEIIWLQSKKKKKTKQIYIYI